MGARAIEPGDEIDRYVVEALLGEGGMGTVYRAYDRRLRRRVALKLVRVGRDFDGRAAARLVEEARAAAALDHPNVVAVFDVGESDGAPFIAMELALGRSLRDYVGEPRVPIATRSRWLVDVARALAAAHARGIVHRDVKPGNVIVRHDGIVKVLDFGLAHRTRDDAEEPPPSSCEIETRGYATVAGTPGYVSPEQVCGGEVDARSDQFAWGVVAYQLLSGEMPWRAEGDALRAVLRPAPPFAAGIDGLPDGVEAIVLRALATQPPDRFASMGDVADALEALAHDRLVAPGGRRAKALAIGALALMGAGLSARDAAADPRAAFERIGAAEDAIPAPPPETAELVLGAIDCDTGVFTMGGFPSTDADVPGGGYNTAQHVRSFTVGAFAKHVQIRLDAAHRRGRPLSASLAFGAPAWTISTTAPDGIGALVNPRRASGEDDFVRFDVGEASGRFTFAVRCGDVVANGPALFNRGLPSTGYRDPAHCPAENPFCRCPPSAPGCARRQHVQYFEHAHAWASGGAFEVEAVPIAIVYAPPADRQKKSFVEYVSKAEVGAKGAPQLAGAPPPVLDENGQAAAAAGALLARTGDAYARAPMAVLDAIAQAARGAAPLPAARARIAAGEGDQVWYREHAYFAWVVENGHPTRVVSLGAERTVARPVRELAADLALLAAGRDPKDTASKLSKRTLASLLALDPFAGGAANAALAAPRFVDVTRKLTRAAADAVCPRAALPSFAVALDEAWTRPEVSAPFPTVATRHGKGWLAFLGLGARDGEASPMSVLLARGQQAAAPGTTVLVASLQGDSADTYCTKVYFDRLFGTFAFQEVGP